MGNKKEFKALEFCYRIAGEEYHSVIYEFDGKFILNELKFTGTKNYKIEEIGKESLKELLEKIFQNGSCDIFPNEYNGSVIKKLFIPVLQEMYDNFPEDVEYVMQDIKKEEEFIWKV